MKITIAYNIVDADSHVLEPPALWTTYIDPEYRDRAPKVGIDSDGEERVHIEGRAFGAGDKIGIRSIGAVGARQGKPYAKTYLEGTRGGFDPHARIKDMDVDGIDAAFLYPTLGLFSGAVKDIGLAAAIAHAQDPLGDGLSTPRRLFSGRTENDRGRIAGGGAAKGPRTKCEGIL